MMEFYDLSSSDLKELWDSYLVEPVYNQDILMVGKDEEWNSRDKTSMEVVLRDRLMTDAALGGSRPIKSEHSYSLSTYSQPNSPNAVNINYRVATVDNSIHSNVTNDDNHKNLGLRTRIDDMEEECFPAISMDRASGRNCTSSPHLISFDSTSDTETDDNKPIAISTSKSSSTSSLSSTSSGLINSTTTTTTTTNNQIISTNIIVKKEYNLITNNSSNLVSFNKSQNKVVPTQEFHFVKQSTSDSEEDDDIYYQKCNTKDIEEENCAVDNNSQSLPPTPPSSASSDSEGTISASCSPERRECNHSSNVQNLRGFISSRHYVTNNGHTTRQPIHTSLISCQPKGSTGVLILTDEEKRTLMAEGYPVPTKLPLTKQEEKSLKKVRRKIKNKISAQESRRKKKEYMDGLERRVTMLTKENLSYKDRLLALENSNKELLKELERLQALVHS